VTRQPPALGEVAVAGQAEAVVPQPAVVEVAVAVAVALRRVGVQHEPLAVALQRLTLGAAVLGALRVEVRGAARPQRLNRRASKTKPFP
jgi:hypothetical protein